jgi:hypothetical protein
MTHLAMALFGGSEDVFGSFGMWAFLSCGAVALFGILVPTVTWIDGRRKEREAFYKAETFRRITESSTEGAKMAIEVLKEESRMERMKHRQGILLGGMISIGAGVGLVIFLVMLHGHEEGGKNLLGLIPALIGLAMVIYAYFMAPPVD